MKCNHCGKSIKDGDKYCKHCGCSITNSTDTDNILAIVSIVFGALSVICCFLFIPFSIVGLVVGLCQKEKSSLKTAGIVLNSIGIFLSTIIFILFFIFAFNIKRFVFGDADFKTIVDTIINKIEDYDEDSEYESKWEMYGDLRNENLGVNKSIDGGWRELSDKYRYVTFKDGIYNIYEDENNKDKYITGEYEILNDINEKSLDKKVDSIIGLFDTIDDEMVSIIELKNDKTTDSEYYLWVLVDHEEEGIEAKVYDLNELDNIDELGDFTSFVKIED